MRQGVFDVLPSNALDGLTAEDLRLLLNGVGDINVNQLMSYTTFNDESGKLVLFLCSDIQHFLVLQVMRQNTYQVSRNGSGRSWKK